MAEETILAKNVQKLLQFRLSDFSFLHLCNVDVDYAIFEIYGNEQRWTQEIITKLKHQFFMLLQYKDRVEDLPLSSKAECSAGRRTNFYTSKIKLFNNLHICNQ